ncbi:MAG: hypothetical protein Q8R92_19180, partial [Deltaproteobacteria bacterium]|nr:hypothetical protein [Deltaproteobacteria bacterium]
AAPMPAPVEASDDLVPALEETVDSQAASQTDVTDIDFEPLGADEELSSPVDELDLLDGIEPQRRQKPEKDLEKDED